MGRRVLAAIAVLLAAHRVSLFAQQQTLNIRGSLGLTTVDPTYRGGLSGYLNLSGYGNIIAPVGTTWTLMLGGADPNTTFALCGSKDDQPGSCASNFGRTDQNGNWTLTGAFEATTIGQWTEWARFPSGAISNRISFLVGDAVSTGTLTINGRSAGVFHVGQPWSLSLTNSYTRHIGQTFDICAEIGGIGVSCTPNFGVVDENHSWTMTSTFSSATIGGWSLWLKFRDGTTTNRIAFTVDDGPLDDLTCANGTIYPIGPNAGYAGFRRYMPDWRPTGPQDFSVVPKHQGGVGNDLEYLGCDGSNYVWLLWEFDALDGFAVRAPWGGQTDRGLRLGDSLARFQSLYPAAHQPTDQFYGFNNWSKKDVWVQGPLVVAFKSGAVAAIMVMSDGFSTDDQKDATSYNYIGPYDPGIVWN